MRLSLALVAVLFALPAVAAPVPKPAKKTVEEKLVGKWRMVKSDGNDNGKPQGYEFYVIFKEKGELELRYEYAAEGAAPQTYTGTFKVIDDTKIDYSVKIGARTKTEVLTIDKLTDTEVAWTDPDKLKEELEKVKDESEEKKK